MNAQNNSSSDITSKVWAIVNALPHRSVIAESDARSWIDEVVHLHGEAAVWHAIRLNGFGGSEIGVLVRNRAGVRADHQASAHDIVAGKLMQKVPNETSGHMTRGLENEEPHSRRFYTKYGATRDVQAFEALKAAQGQRPWMRYSPDDVVQMPVVLMPDTAGIFRPSLNHGKPLRWLIDYKAPSKIEENDEIAFQYACQLTQGAILCAESGIELDGMMLSQFDWANWALKDDAVLWDQSLGELVLDAGDFYWQHHVLRADVPAYIRVPELDGVDGLKTTYAAAAEMFANVSALAGAAKLRADEIRKVLIQPVEGTKLAGQKITFGANSETMTMSARRMLDRDLTAKLFSEDQILSMSSKTGYDADAMARVLREMNVDTKQFRTFELDAVKVYAKASEMGFDADALLVEQIAMAPAKAIKNQMTDFIDQNYPLSQALVERELREAIEVPEVPESLVGAAALAEAVSMQ